MLSDVMVQLRSGNSCDDAGTRLYLLLTFPLDNIGAVEREDMLRR